MVRMFILLACFLSGSPSNSAFPAPKIAEPTNADLIVGVWEWTHLIGRKRDEQVFFEFTRDGRVHTFTSLGKPATQTRYYSIDGTCLIIREKREETGDKFMIISLTRKKLVVENEMWDQELQRK